MHLSTGALVSKDNLKRATLRFILDEKHELSLQTNLQVDQLEKGTRYTPSAELRIPGKQPIIVHGVYTNKPYDISVMELNIDNVFSERVSAKGKYALYCRNILVILHDTISYFSKIISVQIINNQNISKL